MPMARGAWRVANHRQAQLARLLDRKVVRSCRRTYRGSACVCAMRAARGAARWLGAHVHAAPINARGLRCAEYAYTAVRRRPTASER